MPTNVQLSVELALHPHSLLPKKASPASTFSTSLIVAALSLAVYDSISSFLVVWAVSFVTLSAATVWIRKAQNYVSEDEPVPIEPAALDYDATVPSTAKLLSRLLERERLKRNQGL